MVLFSHHRKIECIAEGIVRRKKKLPPPLSTSFLPSSHKHPVIEYSYLLFIFLFVSLGNVFPSILVKPK